MMGLFRKRRETVRLSKVRPLPAWAPYADKMTQDLADQVRSDVEALNNWTNERGRLTQCRADNAFEDVPGDSDG
jgi:hypothetical protein